MIPVYFLFQHGKLKQVRLVTNRSGKSKGFAYVEYEEEVSELGVFLCNIRKCIACR